VFLSAHIAACLLWFISRQEVNLSGDPAGCIFGAYSDTWQEWPLYKKWVSAFYWSVLTVSSIGYGDFLPVRAECLPLLAGKMTQGFLAAIDGLKFAACCFFWDN
jgi:hypothetical protein